MASRRKAERNGLIAIAAFTGGEFSKTLTIRPSARVSRQKKLDN
jgi:hypothetical protein